MRIEEALKELNLKGGILTRAVWEGEFGLTLDDTNSDDWTVLEFEECSECEDE